MCKKVFLINSLTSGGAEKVFSTIVNNLKNEITNIEVICLSKNIFFELDKDINIKYLTTPLSDTSKINKFINIFIFAYKLKKYIVKNKIKLVQSHLYRANFVNCLSKVFGSNHKVQIVNTGAVSMYKKLKFHGKINLFLIKYLYRFADLIIFKSLRMKLDFNNEFIMKNKQVIINNPFDIDLIKELKNEVVSNFFFEKEKKYLISVGRFESFKRQEDIIKVLTELEDNIELVLIGDGYKKNKLIEISRSLNLSKRVHFLGRVKNPYKYISKADIFILSSEDGEGFPNVLIESMICGTPVISSDCVSGPREIISPLSNVLFQLENGYEVGEYGVLFAKRDIKALKRAIDYLLENKLFYILKYNEYSLSFSKKKILNKYKKILGEKD